MKPVLGEGLGLNLQGPRSGTLLAWCELEQKGSSCQSTRTCCIVNSSPISYKPGHEVIAIFFLLQGIVVASTMLAMVNLYSYICGV